MNPFEPVLPAKFELGRLVTSGTLQPDWRCRWCRLHLSATPAGALVCTSCDFTEAQ